MRIFKTKHFSKWAGSEGVSDKSLRKAVCEMEEGLVDVNLGGSVYKKRIALNGKGKSGGVRTLVAYKIENKAFFIYGFAKNERANISTKELKALKLLAQHILNYSPGELQIAEQQGELIEVKNNG